MEINIKRFINLKELITKYSLSQYTLVNLQIGYDDGLYLLFSAHVPERIQGMFVDTEANTEYKALCLWIDWLEGELLGEELLEFGTLKMNFHFIQPLEDHILLLGARAELHQNKPADQNAVFLTREGRVLSRTCFGDGIADCIVLEDGRIITSYFDEGVFGCFTPEQYPGASGLAVWDEQGRVLWKNTAHSIMDCYAVNVDEQNNLWFYYYDDFNLVKTDFKTECVYRPDISGSSSFLIMKSHTGILMDSGYGSHRKLKMLRLLGNRLGRSQEAALTCGGRAVPMETYHFRSSKAAVLDGKGRLYCIDII